MKQQFIKGAWYKTSRKSEKAFQYYVKFSHIEQEYAKSSEYINYNWENHNYCETSDNIKNTNFTLVDISEIAHLLPSNHPDLQQNALNSLEIW